MAEEEHAEHILPVSMYLKVGAALLVLTGITVWVAQYHLGEMNLVVAMLIAAVKASLVALLFMHLKYTNKLYAVVFVGALIMLSVFITFTMFDTMERDDLYEIRSQPINDRAIIYNQSDSSSVHETTTTGHASDGAVAGH